MAKANGWSGCLCGGDLRGCAAPCRADGAESYQNATPAASGFAGVAGCGASRRRPRHSGGGRMARAGGIPARLLDGLRDLVVDDGRNLGLEVDDEALGERDLAEGIGVVHVRAGAGQVGRNGLRERGSSAVGRDL